MGLVTTMVVAGGNGWMSAAGLVKQGWSRRVARAYGWCVTKLVSLNTRKRGKEEEEEKVVVGCSDG